MNLKYLKDPYTDDNFYSFDCFNEQKIFYDCLNHRVLIDSAFTNIENSFYTYLLTGDSNEWIGYVLFTNQNLILSYLENIKSNSLCLLSSIKLLITDISILEYIDLLELRIINNEFNVTTSISILEGLIDDLKNMINLREKKDISNLISIYNEQNKLFLDNYPEEYYLEVVIALPLDTDINTIENKYYGFIRDVLEKVEVERLNNFSNIPIILKSGKQIVSIIDDDIEFKIKKKCDI